MTSVPRWDYVGEGLVEEQLPTVPWPLVQSWVEQAAAMVATRPDLHEPTSMAIATVDEGGRPDVRECLMRFLSPVGPGFVSSRHSAKAAHIAATGVLATSLTWSPLFRAIRFRGPAVEIAQDEVDAYWGERPWGSRISAWASRQSHPVAGRTELEAAVARYAAQWPDRGGPDDVPIPPDWVGYRVVAEQVEFWSGRSSRLHDRFRFVREGAGDMATVGIWTWRRLQP
ncbi:MAG: pyridoxal 5'-phosphate synthase [Austwickia sp.]|nr:pyridoxal 5'-phosphate synthase [Austwickia sp.]MBK8436273.1 pyridoxal 5'-phosphate synthase [Austwickia sp.]